MAAPKRTDKNRLKDLAMIAQLYLQGITIAEITRRVSEANKYSLSTRMIDHDLAEIRKQWLESSVRNFDEARAQELAKLDEVERHAWAAWDRSCGEHHSSRTKAVKEAGEPVKNEAVLMKRDEYGDPRFLAIVKQCIDKRCALLGLDAPDVLEIHKKELTLTFDIGTNKPIEQERYLPAQAEGTDPAN